jgi:hypothetical protein
MFRHAITTRMPMRASSSAVWKPRPELAPVITATLLDTMLTLLARSSIVETPGSPLPVPRRASCWAGRPVRTCLCFARNQLTRK